MLLQTLGMFSLSESGRGRVVAQTAFDAIEGQEIKQYAMYDAQRGVHIGLVISGAPRL